MRHRVVIRGFVSGLLAFMVLKSAIAGPVDLSPGSVFPDLVLPDLDGRARSVREFRGDPLMLHLFASW